MKKIFLAISSMFLFAGLLSSCQKEIAESEEKGGGSSTGGTFTITATIADNGTKVSYAENGTTHALKPSWECKEDQKDIIIGFDSAGDTYGFQVTSVTNGKATFSIITDTESKYVGSATSCPDDGTSMYMFYAPGKKPSEILITKESVVSASLDVDISDQAEGKSGASVPALMMASGTVENGSLSLVFYNQTAIIGIKDPTMGTAEENYSSIALSGTGVNTVATFSYAAGGSLGVSYGTPGTITKAVDFSSNIDKEVSDTTYIVVCPSTSISDLTFTTNNGESFTKSGKQLVASNYYYMTPMFVRPVLLNGEFSVSATKKVKFTNGNLYWDGSAFHVESSQVAYPSSWSDSHVGHFFWTSLTDYESGNTAYMPYASTYAYNSRTYTDNFFCGAVNMLTVDGQSGLYALSDVEWTYLILSRTNASSLYKYPVTVCEKSKCLVIAPDGYTGTIASSYDASAWSTAEAAGLVCLPAAGYRFVSRLYDQGGYGYFWSSSPSGDGASRADDMYFYGSSGRPSFGDSSRRYGYSLRLVY